MIGSPGWVDAVDRMTEESRGRRLDTGLQQLDEWTESANQVEKNALYESLFAVLNGTVFRRYRILNDLERPHEFFVVVRENLVVKIHFDHADTFGILYIGVPIGPPERNVDVYHEA